jgi:hypothetical protein
MDGLVRRRLGGGVLWVGNQESGYVECFGCISQSELLQSGFHLDLGIWRVALHYY